MPMPNLEFMEHPLSLPPAVTAEFERDVTRYARRSLKLANGRGVFTVKNGDSEYSMWHADLENLHPNTTQIAVLSDQVQHRQLPDGQFKPLSGSGLRRALFCGMYHVVESAGGLALLFPKAEKTEGLPGELILSDDPKSYNNRTKIAVPNGYIGKVLDVVLFSVPDEVRNVDLKLAYDCVVYNRRQRVPKALVDVVRLRP